MSNYYAPCFYRIDFVVNPSYIELPCNDTVHKKLSFPLGSYAVSYGLGRNYRRSPEWKTLFFLQWYSLGVLVASKYPFKEQQRNRIMFYLPNLKSLNIKVSCKNHQSSSIYSSLQSVNLLINENQFRNFKYFWHYQIKLRIQDWFNLSSQIFRVYFRELSPNWWN